jgi:hypothetical protein
MDEDAVYTMMKNQINKNNEQMQIYRDRVRIIE